MRLTMTLLRRTDKRLSSEHELQTQIFWEGLHWPSIKALPHLSDTCLQWWITPKQKNLLEKSIYPTFIIWMEYLDILNANWSFTCPHSLLKHMCILHYVSISWRVALYFNHDAKAMRNYVSEIKIDRFSSWGVFKLMAKIFLMEKWRINGAAQFSGENFPLIPRKKCTIDNLVKKSLTPSHKISVYERVKN